LLSFGRQAFLAAVLNTVIANMYFKTKHITTPLGRDKRPTTLVYTQHSNTHLVLITQTGKVGRVFDSSNVVLGGYDTLSSVYASAFHDILGDCIVCVSVRDDSGDLLREAVAIVQGWMKEGTETARNNNDAIPGPER
jgi:hypothetical protein